MTALSPGSQPCIGAFRVGSLCVHADATRDVYLEDFSSFFAAEIQDPRDVPSAGMYLTIVEAPGPSPIAVPNDGMVITAAGEIHTEAMFAQTGHEDGVPIARVTVFAENLNLDERRIYLVVLLNKLLFRLGYMRLHSSAVALDGKVNVFIGDRGAGKSSICAFLAGRGGLVLADDDVMLHYGGDVCVVSGCDETMRIMADTERHLFGRLDAPVEMFGGKPKKQIMTAERFSIEPYVDHALDRMFFPRVGESFSVMRVTPSRVVMRLMNSLVLYNRFAGAGDHKQTLDYLADVAARINAYELTLSPDFSDLEQLQAFLTCAEN